MTYQISMLFRRDPNVPVAPSTKISELLHFHVMVLNIIFDGEARRVIDADIATKAEEDTGGLESKQARVRSVDQIR